MPLFEAARTPNPVEMTEKFSPEITSTMWAATQTRDKIRLVLVWLFFVLHGPVHIIECKLLSGRNIANCEEC